MNEKIMPFLWTQGEEKAALESEIDSIYRAGIRAFIVESRTHPDFCGEGWWRDMDIVLEKAKSLGMRVWVLDDKHYPTGWANDKIAEHPELAQWHIAERIADVFGGRNKRLRILGYVKGDELLYAEAYPYRDGEIDYKSPVEFTDRFRNGFLYFDLPEAPYRVVTIWKTRDGGRENRIDMINPESVGLLLNVVYEPHYARYKESFGNTFAGFFSDEPAFFNDYNIVNVKKGSAYENKLGCEGLAYPISDELLNRLYALPLGVMPGDLIALWALRDERDSEIRCAYMNILTDLYAENFSGNIGKWCKERGVQYIGHVVEDMNCHMHLGCGAGHYFKSQTGQDMAGIDIVLHQLEPGFDELKHYAPLSGGYADPEFFNHTLSTLAFSEAQIDAAKNGNAFCEIFGAYGWNLDISKMKWLIDMMLVGGINHFVPHAFCPTFPNPDCPPHFHAQGNNPQEEAFGYLMKYVSYMCDVLSGGKPVVNIGVLYHAEADWSGREYTSADAVLKILHENQYNAYLVPAEKLEFANGLQCLIVPYAKFLPQTTKGAIEKLHCKVFYMAKNAIGAIIAELNALGLRDVEFECAEKNLRYYHYLKNGMDYYMFFNAGASDLRIRVKWKDKAKYKVLDYLSEYEYAAEESGETELNLPAGNSVLCMRGEGKEKRENVPYLRIDDGIQVSLKAAKERKFTFYKTVSLPFDVLAMDEVPDFAGTARFETKFFAERGRYLVKVNCGAGDVVLHVNGKTVGRRICKPYVFDVSDYVSNGENLLSADISDTLGTSVDDWLSCYTETEPLGAESIEISKIQ